LFAGKHSRQFPHSLFVLQRRDNYSRPLAIRHFLYLQMPIGESGDLWQVGHAQHLGITGNFLQLFPYRFRCPTPDSDINLVKDEHRNFMGALQTGFQRQHCPRNFASRCNLCQRLKRFAGVGGNQKLHLVNPVPSL